ncbi:MAG: DUF4199 family protein [Acidobacteriota bacterium]
MLKHTLVHALFLAVLLALFFVIGNPIHPGAISTFPWLIAMVPVPIVLAVRLRYEFKRNPSLSFGQTFRFGESTVCLAGLLFGAFTLAYSYFYFRVPGTYFLGMTLLLTILGTWFVGTVGSLLFAIVVASIAKRHEA